VPTTGGGPASGQTSCEHPAALATSCNRASIDDLTPGLLLPS
jgi:hypothetical protein